MQVFSFIERGAGVPAGCRGVPLAAAPLARLLLVSSYFCILTSYI